MTNMPNAEEFHIDPRTKFTIIISLSSMAVLLNNIVVLAGLFSLSLFLLMFFKVNIAIVWKRTRALFVIVIFIALLQSLFGQGGKALITLGGIDLITTGGLLLAGEFTLRMLIIFTSACILTTSGSREIIQGLVQWKLPYEIAFMVALALRFLPVFREEFIDARTAIQLRGINLKALKLKQKIMIYASLLQPVVAGALIKSRALSMSMEMRGFRSFPQRISYRKLELKRMDYFVMVSTGCLTIAAFVGYYIWL